MFNSNHHDFGYIYPNYGHGFLDPITGILIWIGLIITFFKKRKEEKDMLMTTGFITIFSFLTFLVNKAPNYTRLLVILPFISFLAIEAIRLISALLPKITIKIFRVFSLNPTSNPPSSVSQIKINFSKIIAFLIIFIIGTYNLKIFNDFVQKGFKNGDEIGSTARYIEARKNIPQYSFFIAADHDHRYFSWGEPLEWQERFDFFVGPNQKSKIISPPELINFNPEQPFTIFMPWSVWENYKGFLYERYPYLKVYKILSDSRLIAVEVN